MEVQWDEAIDGSFEGPTDTQKTLSDIWRTF